MIRRLLNWLRNRRKPLPIVLLIAALYTVLAITLYLATR